MTTSTKPILLTILLSIALTGCGKGDKPAAGPGGAGAAMPPPEVEVIIAASGNATLTQDLPGRLQAYRTAQVRARVEGVIEKRLFQEGSDVKSQMDCALQWKVPCSGVKASYSFEVQGTHMMADKTKSTSFKKEIKVNLKSSACQATTQGAAQ